jgi:hypothetical protein
MNATELVTAYAGGRIKDLEIEGEKKWGEGLERWEDAYFAYGILVEPNGDERELTAEELDALLAQDPDRLLAHIPVSAR